MTISFFYHILLFIGDPILLGGFKIGYEVLDMSVLGGICFGNSADADFIFYGIYEC